MPHELSSTSVTLCRKGPDQPPVTTIVWDPATCHSPAALLSGKKGSARRKTSCKQNAETQRERKRASRPHCAEAPKQPIQNPTEPQEASSSAYRARRRAPAPRPGTMPSAAAAAPAWCSSSQSRGRTPRWWSGSGRSPACGPACDRQPRPPGGHRDRGGGGCQ